MIHKREWFKKGKTIFNMTKTPIKIRGNTHIDYLYMSQRREGEQYFNK